MDDLTLNTLKPSEVGIITRITSVSPKIKQRLLEMGLIKGTSIEIVRYAPLGDPIEISIRGYRLSLRKEEAESIIVSKSDTHTL